MVSEIFDVVVVGSGAAGMSTAITAKLHGLSVVIVEKAPQWGGSTARSGGGVWIPGNHFLAKSSGKSSSEELDDARTYLHHIIGPYAATARIDAYIDRGPEALKFLADNSALSLEWVRGYSDYFPEAPGGRPGGRSCEPKPFDARQLGPDVHTMAPFYAKAPMNVVVKQSDYRWLSTGLRHWRGPWHMFRVGARTAIAKLRRQHLVGVGSALVASLFIGIKEAGIPVRLSTALRELVVTDGRVTGIVTDQGTITARCGVMIACGGFDHNAQMRARHHREPAGAQWSIGATSNTGDGIIAAETTGAAVSLMDDAWWAPSIPLPKGPWFALAERSLPRSILVNSRGQRFMNESLPYVEATHQMFGGQFGIGAGPAENLPAWLIFDQTYRNRYTFAGVTGRAPLPKSWLRSGAIIKADSITELAQAIGVPADTLESTIGRFNEFARSGRDGDFHRGESAYDHYYGDITNKPNPSLGELTQAPFYAALMVPGDLGTKGGIDTDANARALRADGSVIPGLYAAGNASSALMGHTYAGPGATIGPALVFGYLAALDLAAGLHAADPSRL